MKKVLVIGSLNCDYVINLPKMPETGETLLCGGYELVPGGKGANRAYALGDANARELSPLRISGRWGWMCRALKP